MVEQENRACLKEITYFAEKDPIISNKVLRGMKRERYIPSICLVFINSTFKEHFAFMSLWIEYRQTVQNAIKTARTVKTNYP